MLVRDLDLLDLLGVYYDYSLQLVDLPKGNPMKIMLCAHIMKVILVLGLFTVKIP